MDRRLQELLRMMQSMRDGAGGGAGGGSDSDSDSSELGSSSSSSSSSSCCSSDSEPQRQRSSSDQKATFAKLKELLELYHEEPERPFQPGDVVTWKEGLANRKRPRVDEVAVVVEVLPHAVYSKEKSAGSPYFHEPLDIVLGILGSDGDVLRYHFDKHRFRLAAQPSDLGKDEGQSDIDKMREIARSFNEPLELKPGDVVMLKPGLRHRRIPDYETIAVVAEVLPEPYRDTKAESGTSSYYELINGRIALLDNSGDLMFLHVDLRRYRKIK